MHMPGSDTGTTKWVARILPEGRTDETATKGSLRRRLRRAQTRQFGGRLRLLSNRLMRAKRAHWQARARKSTLRGNRLLQRKESP